MSILSGRFTQTISEKKRYMLDYTSDLAPGETIISIVPSVTSPSGSTNMLVIDNVAITPDANQVVFYASGGDDLASYEVKFLATTSIAQIFEDVVAYDLVDKV